MCAATPNISPGLQTEFESINVNGEEIYIINKKLFDEIKKRQFRPEEILICSDFDFTLSKRFEGDRICQSLSNLFMNRNLLEKNSVMDISDDLKKINRRYSDTIYNKNIEYSLRAEKHKQYAIDRFECINKAQVTEDDLKNMAKHQDKLLEIKNNSRTFFELECEKIIFTAGAYQLIKWIYEFDKEGCGELLNTKLQTFPTHIIGNPVTNAELCEIAKNKQELITPYNKIFVNYAAGNLFKSQALDNSDIRKILEDKKLVILMGDHPFDSYMIRPQDLTHCVTDKALDDSEGREKSYILKIGFVNFRQRSSKESIEAIRNDFIRFNFDILIHNNHDLRPISTLLEQLFNSSVE